jgi:hypothetical protein
MRIWAAAGLAINLVTGTLFFVGAPQQYIDNPAWWGKALFLLVAMLSVAFFETRHARTLLTMPAGADTPIGFKIAGGVSIVAWFAVLYFGRMLPFIGTAF